MVNQPRSPPTEVCIGLVLEKHYSFHAISRAGLRQRTKHAARVETR